MTAYAWPSALDVSTFTLQLQSNVRSFASPFGGMQQVTDLLNDRWYAVLEIPDDYSSVVAAYEAFFNRLRGGVHTVGLWHMARPVPQGTMRGAPTLAAAAAAMADSISVQAVAGETLLAGDMLGVGGLLLQVADNVTFPVGGVAAVPLVNRLRKALSSGAAVTHTKPTAQFRPVAPPSFAYGRALVAGQTLEFVEAIA